MVKRSNWLTNQLLRPVRLGERGDLSGLPLREPVEVLQDRWGIPHLFARTEWDLMAAQGFLHARDRLWQMESIRRLASGTMAEVAGERLLPLDRFSRLIGLDRLRRRALEGLPGREAGWFEAYAEGVNSWIRLTGKKLPLEFRTLGLTPSPWKAADLGGSLAVNAWYLQRNYLEEILALVMHDRLTQEVWNELFPSRPGAKLPADDFFTRCRGLKIGPLLAEAMAWYPSLAGLVTGQKTAGSVPPVDETVGASNGWVVAAGEDGAPLLANDVHLGVTVPQVWYINGLHAPGLNLCGVSMPGGPGIVIGRNEHLAWGMANLMLDCVDLFVVKVDPRQPLRYLYRGKYRDMEVERVELRVAGEESRQFVIHRTLHGPVITHIEPGIEAAVCLKWYGTMDDPGFRDTTILGLLELVRTEDVEAALETVGRIVTVGQNFLVADDHGRIGWRPSGRLPVREGYSGRLPADGSSGGCGWVAFLPAEKMPVQVDPPEGFLANANQCVAPEANPHPISYSWSAPDRYQRIEQRLLALHTPTMEEVGSMQMDRLSLRAQRIVPVLLGLGFRRSEALEAAAILKEWDFEVAANSRAALLFNAFLVEATERLFRPLLGEGVRVMHSTGTFMYNTLDRLFEAAGQGEAAGRLPGLLALSALPTPTLEELCEEALVRAMETVRRHRRWGALHTYRFHHPGASPGLASWLLDRGRYSADGDTTTLNVASYNYASGVTLLEHYEVSVIPSMRLVCSLAGLDRNSIMAPMGQSGQPGHPHYDDLIDPWIQGDMVPLPLSREGVERVTKSRLILRP